MMDFYLYLLLILTILSILWTTSTTAKCFIKWFLFFIVSVISATAPIPLMLLRVKDPRNALIPAAGLRAFAKFLGLKITVEGKENIIRDSGCVVLINHQSNLDLLVLACLWPVMDNCTVISKKQILYLQPFGLAAWLWGTIFIDRVKTKDAQETINRTGEIIRKRKARVLIFPEGTRNLGSKKLLPFKKGAFHLALASGVPIQPVAVSRYKFLKKFVFNNGHIRIKILPEIKTNNGKELDKLMDETYKTILDNVNLISAD